MKKLLVISSAIAMLSLSGAAYAGNSSTQVGVHTFFDRAEQFSTWQSQQVDPGCDSHRFYRTELCPDWVWELEHSDSDWLRR